MEDGEEALDYLLRRGKYSDPASSPVPHIVLLDLNLPKLGGREVLARIRQTPDLRRVPVVVLTTSQQEEDVLSSYDVGANSFITKPVHSDQFLKAIHTIEDYWFQIVHLPRGAN